MKRQISILISTLFLLSCTKDKNCFECTIYSDQSMTKIVSVLSFCGVLPDNIIEKDSTGKEQTVICRSVK